MMSILLRQQAPPNVDIDIFTGDPVDYHYFIAVFDKVVEKKIDDPRGRLTRLIKYTDGQPKEMIKHCIQQSAAASYKNADHFLRKNMGIHIKSWQLTAMKSNAGRSLNQQMEQHIFIYLFQFLININEMEKIITN